MKAYKGFDKNLRCRGKQYKIGESYEEPKAKICEAGFHACEHPLDVFGYYAPNDSRYCEVELDGDIDRKDGGDTKVCGTHIKIGAELSIRSLTEAAVQFVFDRAKWIKGKAATGYQGAASATGDRGAASATGKESIACGLGYQCKAKGALGCWIVLAEREDYPSYHIKQVKAALVDGETIKADTYYTLIDGAFVEAEDD